MAQEIISGIYMIRNNVNGKVYVGSSMNIKSRWYFHKNDLRKNQHHSLLLQRSWEKHGEDVFEFSVIENCAAEILIDREQHWIDTLNASSKKHGYNRSPSAGTTAGIQRSDEYKKRMSEVTKGRVAWNKGMKTGKQTPEMIEKRFAKLRGSRRDPSIGQKISATKKALGQKPNAQALTSSAEIRRGKRGPNAGKTFCHETRQKMSESAKARWSKEIPAVL